mmetsp:Transcript_25892/g.59629  ORF Transcript_25892/g.59629 Transcript_25892/m.59629 type:complete len:91 (+) Transcript_25892:955-1227(+)
MNHTFNAENRKARPRVQNPLYCGSSMLAHAVSKRSGGLSPGCQESRVTFLETSKHEKWSHQSERKNNHDMYDQFPPNIHLFGWDFLDFRF